MAKIQAVLFCLLLGSPAGAQMLEPGEPIPEAVEPALPLAGLAPLEPSSPLAWTMSAGVNLPALDLPANPAGEATALQQTTRKRRLYSPPLSPMSRRTAQPHRGEELHLKAATAGPGENLGFYAALFDGQGTAWSVTPRSGEATWAERRYLAAVKKRGLRLYQRFFPDFYRAYPLQVVLRKPASMTSYASHGYGPSGKHFIGFSQEGTTRLNEHELVQPLARAAGGQKTKRQPRIQRKIKMLTAFLHEYAHGIFDEFVLHGQIRSRLSGGQTVYRAMTEGFAVTLELLFMDKMIAARDELKLSNRDVADLRTRKKARLSSLKNKRNAYTEGTFYFWRKIYKQEGEPGLLSFLKALNGQLLCLLDQDELGYQLSQGNPELFKAYLTRPGDPALQRGFGLLEQLVYGHPLGEEDEKLARDALKEVSGPALRRFLRPHLYADRNILKTAFIENITRDRGFNSLVDPFALSDLDGRVAREFAELIAYHARQPRLMAWMLGREPETARRFLEDADRLPFTPRERELWLSGLENWASTTVFSLARKVVLAYLQGAGPKTE